MALCRARQFNYNKSREVVQEAVVEQSRFLDKPHLGWLTLFITSGTLLCCALPILLVSLGFGAVAASLNYNIPGLLFLAENKCLKVVLPRI